jgi:anti-anti-sigma factor
MIIEIKEVPEAGAVILQFSGELSSNSITKLSDCFNKIEKAGKYYAIADMSAARLISSAALGEFMGGRKRLIERGGDLVFACLDMELRSKLAMMGATKIFRIYNDIRSAIQSFNWQSGKHPDQIKITFPSNLTLVPPIRQLTSRIAKQKGYSNRDAFRIETIVDEICNNAVEHGKQGDDQIIDFKIDIDPKKIELDITNISDPNKISSLKKLLKPKEVSELDTEEKRGRGLALIKMLSDELSVNCSEKGTVVHVKKIREE